MKKINILIFFCCVCHTVWAGNEEMRVPSMMQEIEVKKEIKEVMTSSNYEPTTMEDLKDVSITRGVPYYYLKKIDAEDVLLVPTGFSYEIRDDSENKGSTAMIIAEGDDMQLGATPDIMLPLTPPMLSTKNIYDLQIGESSKTIVRKGPLLGWALVLRCQEDDREEWLLEGIKSGRNQSITNSEIYKFTDGEIIYNASFALFGLYSRKLKKILIYTDSYRLGLQANHVYTHAELLEKFKSCK